MNVLSSQLAREMNRIVNDHLLGSCLSCKAVVNTSRGPAKSMRLNLGCRAKSTSIGSSATAEVLLAIFGNLVCIKWGECRCYWRPMALLEVDINTVWSDRDTQDRLEMRLDGLI